MIGEVPKDYDLNGYVNLLQSYGPLLMTSAMDPRIPFNTLPTCILSRIKSSGRDSGTILKLINLDAWTTEDETFIDFVDRFEAEEGADGPVSIQIGH